MNLRLAEADMKERLLLLLLMSCASLVHADDRTEDQKARIPVVIDAKGQPVGEYTAFGSVTEGVLVSIGERHAVIPIHRKWAGPNQPPFSADLYVYDESGVSFPTPDCSGDPFVNYQAGPSPAMAYRDGAKVIVYFAANGPGRQVRLRSQRLVPSYKCVAYNDPTPVTVYPAGAKVVITDQHPEPLSVGW
jgi:hypothetical protein